LKVLIADDHPLMREASARVLREIDSEVLVLEAADSDGVRQLTAEHPDLDLVLLDLRLPGVSGLELFEALRRDHPTLPLVALSAVDDPATVKAALACGALGFIPKSSSRSVMVSAIQLVMAGGRYLPPELIADEGATGPQWAATPPGRTPMSADALGLTERQRQVLRLMAQGKSNKQICRELGLAEPTVKSHVTAVLKALKVTSRTQAVVMINRLGMQVLEPRSGDAKAVEP